MGNDQPVPYGWVARQSRNEDRWRATPAVEDAPHDTGKRPLRLFTQVGLALVAGWVEVVSAKVLFPAQGVIHGQSYAVVNLAPQHHRLHTAIQLVEASHTDTLRVFYFCRRCAREPRPCRSRAQRLSMDLASGVRERSLHQSPMANCCAVLRSRRVSPLEAGRHPGLFIFGSGSGYSLSDSDRRLMRACAYWRRRRDNLLRSCALNLHTVQTSHCYFHEKPRIPTCHLILGVGERLSSTASANPNTLYG